MRDDLAGERIRDDGLSSTAVRSRSGGRDLLPRKKSFDDGGR
ncbi:hypothetical protein [Amycolatopsis sp. lyj-90]